MRDTLRPKGVRSVCLATRCSLCRFQYIHCHMYTYFKVLSVLNFTFVSFLSMHPSILHLSLVICLFHAFQLLFAAWLCPESPVKRRLIITRMHVSVTRAEDPFLFYIQLSEYNKQHSFQTKQAVIIERKQQHSYNDRITRMHQHYQALS